ncbi:hypothetical protein ACFQHK_18110 [Halomarina ordinaria]|uniref:DUF4198 domain-containing protein n=1 Tax=Halomarina ordinaria TaxID=3033939 RepID=A0ABD5UFM9_9EURY
MTVAANGLHLDPADTRLDSGVTHRWTYRIRDDSGAVVTEFEEAHDQLAHLILVRRDLAHFQHLHPTLGADGTWTTTFTLPEPGTYRAFVDVVVDAQSTTLGVDILTSGAADYETHPEPTRTKTVEGYTVTMTPEHVTHGTDTPLEFEIRGDGGVAHLDPYLGALGHLVALRDGDLAYLHVHPEKTDPKGGVIRFIVQFPTPGRYRLFLQAKPHGELITTWFDVRIDHRPE